MSQSLAQRSISSVKWNAVSSIVQVIVGFIQTIVLARLLPIEVFGVYAAAKSVIGLTIGLPAFGMASSFLYRSEHNLDIEQSAAIHFTIKSALTVLWFALMLGGTLLLVDPDQPDLKLAFVVITMTAALTSMTQTPRLILSRKVLHKRLATLQVIDTIVTTIVTIGLALGGVTLWALLMSDVVTTVVAIFMLYIWRPVWRPRFTWHPAGMRYFLTFGASNVGIRLLTDALDRLDDVWTGAFLGKTPLGFYSKAYSFAKYPSIILASPLEPVSAGMYAEVGHDRKRLSSAFFMTNALLVRSGFLLAGLLALVAPEFIILAIGERWLPMLDAFRLMLIFTLFDPMKRTIANMFVGVGKPRIVLHARILQLVIMGIGLFTLGPALGIAGVALAVDIMLVIGIGYVLWRAKEFVDYSLVALMAWPGIALTIGLIGANLAFSAAAPESPWISGIIKVVCFTGLYGLILLLFERQQLMQTIKMVRKHR